MVFCIMGKSASGKDTVYKELLMRYDIDVNVMYTTRPKRTGETNCITYYYVTEEEYELMKKANLIIEERSYNTNLGLWRYFTSKLEFKDDLDYLIVNTLEGYNNLKNYFGDEIIPIYIEVEDGERLQRALDRERQERNPKYQEMARRFLADSEDFSEEKLKEANITNRFKNIELEDTVNEIGSFLESHGIKKNKLLIKKMDDDV